mmetsp:Transcript_7069/g.25158  ORF Transcript_7069/g.25158 Transcript_7069/m.25158 type:complete len:385 (+) Transcript_7069:2796-3950(+)
MLCKPRDRQPQLAHDRLLVGGLVALDCAHGLEQRRTRRRGRERRGHELVDVRRERIGAVVTEAAATVLHPHRRARLDRCRLLEHGCGIQQRARRAHLCADLRDVEDAGLVHRRACLHDDEEDSDADGDEADAARRLDGAPVPVPYRARAVPEGLATRVRLLLGLALLQSCLLGRGGLHRPLPLFLVVAVATRAARVIAVAAGVARAVRVAAAQAAAPARTAAATATATARQAARPAARLARTGPGRRAAGATGVRAILLDEAEPDERVDELLGRAVREPHDEEAQRDGDNGHDGQDDVELRLAAGHAAVVGTQLQPEHEDDVVRPADGALAKGVAHRVRRHRLRRHGVRLRFALRPTDDGQVAHALHDVPRRDGLRHERERVAL